MCTFWDRLEEEYRIEGRAQGIVQMGLEYRIPEKDILAQLQKQLDVSVQKAREYLDMFGKRAV